MKERNKTYMLNAMQPGERFYFLKDRKKTVWQLSDTHPFEKKIQKGFTITYANTRQSADSNATNEKFIANRHYVVFLRDINSPENTNTV